VKTSAAQRILEILKSGPLYDNEVAQKLPAFSRNTIRRARRELVSTGKIVPVRPGRIVPYKLAEATA
jgi:DNA-binding GntR family transcriptional regulator